MANEYVSMKEAQVLLRVSRTKMWSLVKEATLKTYFNPLDKRKHLIKLEDIEKLLHPQK